MMLDDKRVFLFAGEFDYFRLPSPSLWYDVLQKMKASGFNAVSIYFDWAYHSSAPGVYDFTGVRDVDQLLTMAAQAGMYVIARPGPYVNGEIDGGGLPGWVDTQASHARSSAPDYLAAAEQWLGRIDAILARHQLTSGTGTVILDQIENEYCFAGISAGLDGAYMSALEQKAHADGITVPLFTNACYPAGAPWSSGTGAVPLTAWDAYPNGFTCTGSTWGSIPDYTNLRTLTPASEPEYLAEFQGGSFDSWGGSGFAACRAYDNGPLERMISETAITAGVTAQSYYMEYGGTNWGWDTKLLTANYQLGGQHLVYSTSELMTQASYAGGDLAVFYGRSGLSGQCVLRYSSQPAVSVLSGSATSSYNASTGDLTLSYVHNGLTRVKITGGGRPTLLLLIGDDAAAASMWLDGGILSDGQYLVRTANVTGSTLALTGDASAAGTLEVFPPAGVSTLTWNGSPLTVISTGSGSWTRPCPDRNPSRCPR